MKHILTALLTFFGLVAIAAPASAQISNTGPGSTNSIVDNSSTTCTSTSTNTAQVSNNTSQSGSSGSASASGNTTAGGATSGSVTNTSTTNTSLVLTNGNACAPAAVTPTPPKPGGKGGGAVLAESTSQAPVVVASLPQTGEVTSADIAAGTTAAVTGLILLATAVRAWKFGLNE